MTCAFCNDMWLQNAGDPRWEGGTGFGMGNKCLCNETRLKIEKRKIQLEGIVKNIFDKADSCSSKNMDGCADITIHGKGYQVGFNAVYVPEDDTIGYEYRPDWGDRESGPNLYGDNDRADHFTLTREIKNLLFPILPRVYQCSRMWPNLKSTRTYYSVKCLYHPDWLLCHVCFNLVLHFKHLFASMCLPQRKVSIYVLLQKV